MRKVSIFLLFFFAFTFVLNSSDIDDFKIGYSFFQDGYYDLAEGSFYEFLSKYKNSIYQKKSIFYLGLSLLEQNKYKDALNILEKLKDDASFEYFTDVCYYLSLLYAEDLNYKSSEKSIQKTFEAEKDQKRVEKLLFLSIQNSLKLDDIKSAVEKAKEYFENSSYSLYHYEVSQILSNYFMGVRDYYNASQVLESILLSKKDNKNDKTIYHNYMLSLKELKKYDEAINFFDKNINYYDKSIYEMLSDIYYEKNDKNRALETLKKVFYRGKTLLLMKKIVTILLELNKTDDAINFLESEKRDLELELLLAELYYKTDKITDAFNTMDKLDINKFKSANLILYFNSALKLDKTNAIKKYINYFDKLIILEPNERENILYKLAEIYYNDGDYKNANVVFKRYLNEFQSGVYYEKMLFIYGVSLKNEKRYSDAIVEFSKIQKRGKKDEIYYESFVEKGEIYFILEEYRDAIDNYKLYLQNKSYNGRKKEVLLQLSNGYYNIKNYKLAYQNYKNYLTLYGDSEDIQNKIAYSLLKDDNYKEILAFFGERQKTYDFQKYLIVLSNYKLKEFEKAIQTSNDLLIKSNNNYYYDISYINLMSRIETANYSDIESLYESVIGKLDVDSQKSTIIKKEFYKIFVKLGKVEYGERVFKNTKDVSLLFFIGETLYNNLYIAEASSYFKRVVEKESLFDNFEKRELTVIVNCLMLDNQNRTALDVVNAILKREPNDISTLLKKVDIISNDSNLITANYNFGVTKIDNYFNQKREYVLNQNYQVYKNFLLDNLKAKEINDIFNQNILLELMKIEYGSKNYKDVINHFSKLPEKIVPSITPEFKYLQAEAYNRLGDTQKALTEYLKIYYLYPYSNYWVTLSIKEILKIYDKNGDKDRYQKTLKMFEDRYFKLH